MIRIIIGIGILLFVLFLRKKLFSTTELNDNEFFNEALNEELINNTNYDFLKEPLTSYCDTSLEEFIETINEKSLKPAERELLLLKLSLEDIGTPEERLTLFLSTFRFGEIELFTNLLKPLINQVNSIEPLKLLNTRIQNDEENEKISGDSYSIAIQYASGVFAKKDIKKAIKYYQKAIDEGEVKGYFDLALIYFSGYEVEKNEEKAFHCLLKGFENNYLPCIPFLAYCYFSGKGTEINYSEGYKVLNFGFAKDFLTCVHIKGFQYAIGAGVPKNRDVALYLESKAEKMGMIEATVMIRLIKNKILADFSSVFDVMRNIGHINIKFLFKIIVKQYLASDKDEERKGAFDILVKLAEYNYPEAQYQLGQCYYYGDYSIEKNFEQAVYWWNRAMDNGSAAAEFDLGTCYMDGEGVEQDKNKGLKLWLSAAKKGDGYAMCKVGSLYADGLYLKKNVRKGLKYLKKARKLKVENADTIYNMIKKRKKSC